MQPQQQTRLIHCYDVVSFVTEIEKAVKDGFSLDLKNVQHYPVQLGYQFITTMIKDETVTSKLTLKVDASAVQEIVDDALEQVKKAQEDSEIEKVAKDTTEEHRAAVGAPKKPAGRPAKGK